MQGAFLFVALLASTSNVQAVSSQKYTWNNVKIGGGGTSVLFDGFHMSNLLYLQVDLFPASFSIQVRRVSRMLVPILVAHIV